MTPPQGNGSSIRDRAAAASPDDQIEMNEKQIDNPDLAALLEERHQLAAERLTAQKAFKLKDDAVKARLSEFELAVGEVARCGRFKIKKTRTAGGEVEFERAPSDQLRISIA